MISIIIPVYNAEKFLEKCLNSLLNQTFKDIEFIMVDDGSTDNSVEICRDFCEKDVRFKFFTKENGGPMLARKYGLERASGNYIGFIDSDDWAEPEMFEEMLAALIKNDADISCCSYKDIYPDNIVEIHSLFKDGVYERKDIESVILPILFNVPKGDGDFNRPLSPTMCCKVYKKQILIDNLCYFNKKVSFGEDLLINASVILSAQRIVMLTSKCLYNYSRREGTLSGKYIANLEEQTEELLESLRQIIKDKDGSVCFDSFHRDMFSFQIKLLRNAKLSDKTKKEKLADFKRILNSKYVKESLPYAKKNFGTFKGKIKYLLIKFRMKRLLFSLLV